MLTRSTLSDVVKYVQRTLADCTQFFCAGRAGFPEFCKGNVSLIKKVTQEFLKGEGGSEGFV